MIWQENAAMPYMGMILATIAQVGLIIISKKAMATGMTNLTFVAYSNTLAALILLPFSLLVHRSSNRPPLNFLLLCQFFSLGVLGCTAQLTGYTGINYTNAEFASAMLNLIPAFTFVLAVICRMEKLACGSSSFMAKVTGAVVSIAGAFIVTLYKGPQILSFRSSSTGIHHLYTHIAQSSWMMGGFFLSLDCAAASIFIIVQALILKKYPAELIIVFFYCLFAAILSTAVSLIVDTDLSAWSLLPSIRWIAILYSGVLGSAFQVSVVAWYLHKRGPLFVAMFHPLSIVIAAAVGITFLGDILYLGSLVGSVIIVIGFYSVMWGKAKEVYIFHNSDSTNSDSISSTSPLLSNKNEHV